VHNNASEQTPMALQCRHYLRYRPSTPLAQLNLEPLWPHLVTTGDRQVVISPSLVQPSSV
jgi:hypothetical protein